MEKQEKICKEIKKNKWLNGYYDMMDGDVCAMVVDKEHLDRLHEVKTIKTLWKHMEIIGYNGNYIYKNIVFANHWNYGCFVYLWDGKKLIEFEHLTLSAYKYNKFESDIERMTTMKKKEDIKKIWFGD